MTQKELNEQFIAAINEKKEIDIASVDYRGFLLNIDSYNSTNTKVTILYTPISICNELKDVLEKKHLDLNSAIKEIDWAYKISEQLEEEIKNLKKRLIGK